MLEYIITEQFRQTVVVFFSVVLIFSIFFFGLQASKMFKKGSNTIIALIFALMVAIPHFLGKYPVCYDPIIIISQSIAKVMFLVIFLVTFMLILVAIGVDIKGMWMGLLALLSVVFVVWAFLSSRGPDCKQFKAPWLDYILNNVWYVLPIIIGIAILGYIMRSHD